MFLFFWHSELFESPDDELDELEHESDSELLDELDDEELELELELDEEELELELLDEELLELEYGWILLSKWVTLLYW